jgi:hypothetical protein
MQRFMSPFLRVILLSAIASAQIYEAPAQIHKKEEPGRLPDGRSQSEEILKADHQQNLKEAAELVKLAEDLKAELEKNDRHVLSMGAVKKTDDIERLAKRIRGRLKRY